MVGRVGVCVQICPGVARADPEDGAADQVCVEPCERVHLCAPRLLPGSRRRMIAAVLGHLKETDKKHLFLAGPFASTGGP